MPMRPTAQRRRTLFIPLLTIALVLGLFVPAIAGNQTGIRLNGNIPDRVREAVDLERDNIPALQAALEAGDIDSQQLTRLYLERIAAFDTGGPSLNSILAVNPNALDIARELDRERRRSGPRGPLHGIPVVLKDNIDTDDMPTTAGSQVFEGSVPPQDAYLTDKLREAGAIVLGKTTMTEFANYMTSGMPGGYSSLGGQGLNPYNLQNGPSGSSAGSGIAAAAGMAAGTVGTETSGSILSPARANSVVGLKPTLGLISRTGIVPLAESQDTAGPMTKSVADAAIMLGAMTGVDPEDPRTAESEGEFLDDYTPFLDEDALDGARIGYVTNVGNVNNNQAAVIDDALDVLVDAGAELVDVQVSTAAGASGVFAYEFQRDMNAYLERRGTAPVSTLGEIIEANEAIADSALKFGQTTLINSNNIDLEAEEATYLQNLETGKANTQNNIDSVLEANDLDALVFRQQSAAGLAARAGYPSLVVPAGYTANNREPVGITFVGTAWDDAELLGYAYAFEQAADVWQPPSEINPSAFRCPAPVLPQDRNPLEVGACT
jgi:amidase